MFFRGQLAVAFLSFLSLSKFVHAQTITQLCQPVVSDPVTVASAAQRLAAGNIAEPPLTDMANGFA
jgi:hypothetical protein